MITKQMLGTILHAAGLLSREQVQEVLKAQTARQEAGEKYLPFGEVALHLKHVTVHQLRAALELQKRLVFPTEETKRLGLYMLESRLVKPDALVQALEKQRLAPTSLEAVLLDMGLVSEPVLHSVLQALGMPLQPRAQPSAAPPSPPAGAPSARKPPTLEDLLRENHQLRELVGHLRRENAGLKERLAQTERA